LLYLSEELEPCHCPFIGYARDHLIDRRTVLFGAYCVAKPVVVVMAMQCRLTADENVPWCSLAPFMGAHGARMSAACVCHAALESAV
jgi:hypothetical protein